MYLLARVLRQRVARELACLAGAKRLGGDSLPLKGLRAEGRSSWLEVAGKRSSGDAEPAEMLKIL
jgi:hypothetical protein